ncbi:MAG TPA: ATP-dependent 6-phosphofructokinase [Planctomycetota bacterium]|jgi:6-phosphofructokinase 1
MHLLVNTGGGDAPGLNAVIRGVVLSAIRRGWHVSGIRRGYNGLLEEWPHGVIKLGREHVRGIAHVGGTILGTVNKGNPFEYPVKENGKVVLKDVSDLVLARMREVNADGLIAIGGDGSLRIAQKFIDKGMKVIGVPKTIDNDLSATQVTFGFDSAVSVATDAIDRLHSTAESHQRVMVVEVMGRYAGWIALNAGVSGGANVVLIPEIEFDIEKVCASIKRRYETGRCFAIVVAAEGAKPKGGQMAIKGTELGREVRLGGIAEQLAAQIGERTGFETRSLVLGHLQRGGGPTTFDRLLALRFGCAAARLVEQGRWGHMVAWQPPSMVAVPIKEAISKMKDVPLDHDTVLAARDLGVCLGD